MIKKFIAVAAFAIALAVAGSASAATWDFGSTAVRRGSTGTYAMNVQAALNACGANPALVVDGNFGMKSATAAKNFQTLKGLSADGVVGAATKAALNNCGTTVPATPSAGLCPNGMTLASNCTLSPSGTPTNTSSAPLSINNVSAVSGNLNTSVGVGQVDKPIANIRMVTGAGGSASLTGLNLSFFNFGSGDYQFTKYASSVGVWLNGVKVGSLDAGQFAQYNSVYSAYVPVSGATLAANSTNNIVLSVTALPVIDTANMSADVWGLDVTSIRYSDATGVFTYTPSNIFGNAPLSGTSYSSSNTYFSFASAASAQSIKLTVTKNLSDSNDSVVSGSASANTNGIQLAKIDLNAQGSTINVRRLPVTLTVGGSATIPSAVVNTLRLYDASGAQLDSQAVDTSGGNGQTITFQNLNLNVTAGATTTLTIKGDFNTVGGATFPAGSYAQVSVSSTNVGNIQAYDSGSNVLSGSTYLTGSTTGSKVYVYVDGISVSSTGAATTNVSTPGGSNTHTFVTYTIPFSVTAFGSTAYVPTVASAATSASAAQAIQFCIDATTACAAAGSGTVYYTGNDTITTANNNFQVPVGQTKNFNLVITYQPASNITTRATLLNVNWSATDATALTSSWKTYTAGLNSNAFKTTPMGAY